jgi:hypothetical protein
MAKENPAEFGPGDVVRYVGDVELPAMPMYKRIGVVANFRPDEENTVWVYFEGRGVQRFPTEWLLKLTIEEVHQLPQDFKCTACR